ncbi:MAG: rRNA pseudouridine synthase [Gallionella sp.]
MDWLVVSSDISIPRDTLTASQLSNFDRLVFMTEPIRLAKRLVEMTACSRREAELLITGGWVSVAGVLVEEPQFMVDEQVVELHPDAVALPLEPVTLLVHQAALAPDLALNADTRAADDESGIRLLKQHRAHLTACLPLERNASGLVVLTQDWRVARKLNDDAALMEQEYIVEVAGTLSAEGLRLLNHGLKFNGRALSPIKVSWQNETKLRFAVKGLVAGQITHACTTVGLQVIALKRIRIGRVAMAKLPLSTWRYLMPHEKF